MTREEREALSQHICNFCYDSAKKSVKTTVNYFKKQNVPQNTIYYVLKKYLQCGTTKDLSRSGRPLKLSKNLNNIVKSVNNRSEHRTRFFVLSCFLPSSWRAAGQDRTPEPPVLCSALMSIFCSVLLPTFVLAGGRTGQDTRTACPLLSSGQQSMWFKST